MAKLGAAMGKLIKWLVMMAVAGLGLMVLLVGCFVLVVGSGDPAPDAAKSLPSAPRVAASLDDFTVDRGNSQFIFTLKMTNEEAKENTVYVAVYGKNDMFSPPRRNAWPLDSPFFRQAGTNRGMLSAAAVSRDWDSRPESTKGAKFRLKANESESLEGALPINQTSPFEAWRGQRLDPRAIYNEVYLWVFSEDGRLIVERKYNVQ